MKFLAKLEKGRDIWILIWSCVLFFLLRLPSLFEPRWYGDEGIYQVIGLALRDGGLLYRDTYDNKPPLLYLIYALGNADQFWIRLMSLIVGILTIVTLLFLAKKLFINNKAVYVSVFFFSITFGVPYFEGNIANAENFMLLPILLAGYFVFEYEAKHTRFLFLAGTLLSLAFLIKIVGLFDAVAFGVFLVIQNYTSLRNVVQTELKRLFPLIIGFLIPIFLTGAFFYFHGALSLFISAAFQQNVGYVGYGNTFIIPQGLLILKLVALGATCFYLFIKRRSISPAFMFILLWLMFSLFNAYFSGRPYTHYLLVLLPSFSLLIGTLFETAKKRTVQIILVIGISLLVYKSFDLYTKTPQYYGNFLSFMTGGKSLSDYRGFFDKRTPMDYDLTRYLKEHMEKNDRIFLWGNSAQVYALVKTPPPGRYAVAYHILWSEAAIRETTADLKLIKPRFIILTSVQPFPFNLNGYAYTYTIGDMNIYEKIR